MFVPPLSPIKSHPYLYSITWNGKRNFRFLYSSIWQILEPLFVEYKLWNLEECAGCPNYTVHTWKTIIRFITWWGMFICLIVYSFLDGLDMEAMSAKKPLRKDTLHRRFFGSVWLHNHLITWTCLSLARADLKYYTYLHKYIQSYKQTVFYNNFIFSQPNLPF